MCVLVQSPSGLGNAAVQGEHFKMYLNHKGSEMSRSLRSYFTANGISSCFAVYETLLSLPAFGLCGSVPLVLDTALFRTAH